MIKKITRLLFVCLLSIIGHNVLAVPAVPWPVEKIQPDGSKITVYLRGDEKVHWMESLDGYTLMYDAQKYIVYAEDDVNKNMIPSKSRYSGTSAAPNGVAKGIRYSQSQVKALEQIWKVTDNTAPQRAITGSRKALCVMMDFQDRDFIKSKSEFETLFNQIGLYPADNSSKGSVRDFFRENSYGQLDLTVTLVGPYKTDYDMIYYANQPNDAGYRWFAEEAARKADADVDYNDFAENGVLETFHILFAGYGDESVNDGNQIWSHEWQLASPITLDGVRISVYSCSPELRGASGTNTTYIGVICHELNHVLGAPDYYDTGSTGYVGTGNWDLMANGSWNDNGRQPAHVNMFQKILYGWVTPVELTSYTEVTAMPPSAEEPVAYSIKANVNGEMYVLENRQRIGFDGSVPGHGLLIWHVHQNALTGNGSNSSHPQQLYPVCASSSYAIPTGTVASYGNINSGGTPFPGTAGKTAFSAKTTPTMFSWAGLQPIAKPLTGIAEASDNTVSFKFLDGPTDPVINLQAGVTGGNVTLTWTAPDRPDVLGYKIYRDGTLQYTINNKATTTYTQIGVANGTYEYGVSAFYESTESVPVTATVIVTTGSDTYRLPPTDLQGRTTLDKAYLNWTRPFNGGWMTIAGSAATVYSFNEEFTFFAGTLWGPDQLKGLDGYDATQIQFYLYETTGGVTHAVQIWEVDDTGVPVLVRTQNYTGAATAGLKTVTLSSPLTIDASKEYLIGVEIHTLGGACFVVDANSIVPGRNWISEEGEWYTMEDAGFTNNFITSVYLSSGNPSAPNPNVVLDSRTQKAATADNLNIFAQKAHTLPVKSALLNAVKSDVIGAGPAYVAPALTKYNIYRDGVKVGESTTTSFEDSGLTAGTTYSYCVSSVYSNDSESEGICIELVTLSPVNAFNPAENVTAKAAGDEVTLTWDAPYSGGTATYVTSTAAPSSTNVNTANFTEAIRFDSDDMKRMEGFNITTVRFHPGNSTAARTYTIQIWSGGNGTTPGTLVYEQPATFTNNAWTDVTLNSPVPVNIYEDLWIGVKVTRTAGSGNYPSPRYTSGVVNGKSNLYNNGTTWSTTNNVVWPISATIAPGTGVSSLTGYRISRNGTDLEEASTSTFSYLDEGLQPGDYNYCVTAIYGTDESEAACASVTAEEPLNPYKPAENLEAVLVENKVTLDWETPFKGGLFGYSAQTPYTAYNTTGIMAARFTREDLKKLLGTRLTRVYFAVNSTVTTANTTYTLRIYAGANGDEPERVIYEQTIPSFSAGAWNAVTLSTPIDVNVYEDLWIGIVVAARGTATGIYRMAVDAGPAVDGKGNAFYYNNNWTTLSGAGGGDYNWAILGYAEPGSSLNAPAILSHENSSTLPEDIVSEGDFSSVLFNKDKAPVLEIPELKAPQAYATPESFLLSRNGENIATVAGDVFTYDDFLSVTGDYTYCVTALYDGGHESDIVCDDVSFVNECDAKPENVIAARTDNEITINWDFTPIVLREDTVFSEDFANGIPATWGNIDADNDGKTWTASTGAGVTGAGFVTSASYDASGAITPDNWLITPAISISKGNRLNYYVKPSNASFPEETYGVFISTTGSDIASFDATPLRKETLQGWNAWQKRIIDLSAYEGETVYIAFRHYDCSDQVSIQLDDISITKDADPVFNIYENDALIDQVTGNRYERTLTESGTYTYCVSFVGDYCESELACADAVDFYQLNPTIAVADKVYDTTKDATVESVTFEGLDGMDVLENGVDYTTSAEFSDPNVGTDIPVDVTITLSETAAAKYWLPANPFSTTADITPAELTLSGVTAVDRAYNGTTNIAVTGTPTLSGIIGTDDVTLAGTPSYTLASPDAGEDVVIIVSGVYLDGAQAGNYVLAPLTVNISPAELTLSGLTAHSKIYDRTTTATVTGTPTLSGIIGTDDVKLTGTPSYDFVTSNVGSGISIYISGTDLDGAQAGNYYLLLSDNLSANIFPVELTISGLAAQNKVYDGTTAAAITGTPTLSGIIGTDNVSLGGVATAAFASANVGKNINVSLTGLYTTGSQGANYTVIFPALSADITPATIIITPTENQWKYVGAEDPSLSYDSEGWKLNHGDELLTGTLTRTAGEAVGSYPILQGTLAVTSTNYIIDFTGDVLFEIRDFTGIESVNVSGLKVYPNPVRSGHEFTVESKTPNAMIQLFSISGTLLKEQKATNSVTKMNLTLPAGIYILSVNGEKVRIEIR
ncbi:MAG: M6 family metalloprotease domain-containing protein [Candidatus Azobacteroides sp.]|nr:M6 family metalloprotease domain-containing protein [Candidatus Azobacteroides sp.]